MYNIVMYTDDHGNCPISGFMRELDAKSKTSKNDRIQLKQIIAYVKVLKELGTRAGEEFVKHIENDIWELRPGNNRIFFFVWNGNNIVLLHNFHKKTKKTPLKEIKKAKKELDDWVSRNGH